MDVVLCVVLICVLLTIEYPQTALTTSTHYVINTGYAACECRLRFMDEEKVLGKSGSVLD